MRQSVRAIKKKKLQLQKKQALPESEAEGQTAKKRKSRKPKSVKEINPQPLSLDKNNEIKGFVIKPAKVK